MDLDFEEKCLKQRSIVQKAAVTLIGDAKTMQRLAEQHEKNSRYFLESAQNLLSTSTPLAAIILAYFAMEHKANQLLALHGYNVESHLCTQMGLSRIVGKKELAKMLSDMFTWRQNIGYRLTLTQSEESKQEAEKTMQELVLPFLQEIDKLVNLRSL